MHLLHLAGEGVTLALGAEKVARGELTAGELGTIMFMVSHMIGPPRPHAQGQSSGGRVGGWDRHLPSRDGVVKGSPFGKELL